MLYDVINILVEQIVKQQEDFVIECIRELYPEFNENEYRRNPWYYVTEHMLRELVEVNEYHSEDGKGRVLDVYHQGRLYKRLKIKIGGIDDLN